MSRLEELLLRWQDRDLNPQELEELGRLLETPEARALLMEDFVATNTIREALRTDSAARPAGDSSNAARAVNALAPKTRRSVAPPGADHHWWKPLLVAAGLLVAAAVLWSQFSSGPDDSRSEREARQAELKRRKQEEDRIRAEAERRLAEIEHRRKILEEQKTAESAAEQEKRKKELADLAEARRRIEEEQKAALARAQQAPPPKEDVKEPVPPPQKPATEPERKGEAVAQTEAAVVKLEGLEGEGSIITPSGKIAAKAGENLLAGQGLEVASKSQALLVYPDKTRVEVAPETELRELKAQGGKRFFLARGEVRAVVSKQPLREEMIIATPHGEAKIVGTTLRIVVEGDPKKGMKLEVEEGKVQLKNLAGKMVDVPSGHYAVAASGLEMTPRPGVVPPGLLAGLVGHWRMDDFGGDVAVDSSGHGLDGKVMNGATVVKGKVAGALRLNGTNQFVDLGRGPDLPGPYTLALWIRLTALSNQTIMSDFNAANSQCHFAIEVVPSGQLRYVWIHGDLSNQVVTQESLAAGVWYHLAFTKDDAGNVKLYVNGKPVSSLIRDPKYTVKRTLPNEFGPYSIGRPGNMDKGYTNGLIDDVRAYSRSLEPEEIVILSKLGDH